MVRFIGDIHGRYQNYLELISNCSHSVQLGDFGFDYNVLENVDPERHKICAGNHENYHAIKSIPHYLGDFGSAVVNDVSFFFVRGAMSLDKNYRIRYEFDTQIKTWYEEEELTQREGLQCLDLYEETKPDFVISHDCPIVVKSRIQKLGILPLFGLPEGFNCSTQHLLQQMWEIHQPKLWCFGHWHMNADLQIENTRFICVYKRDYVEVNENLDVVWSNKEQ
jgi:hypothetical protein